MKMKPILAAVLFTVANFATAQQPPAQQPPPQARQPPAPPGPQDRVASLKASIASSQSILRRYEWIETTVVSVKGKEKSRQMQRCYYGADGNLQKVPVTAPPEQKKGFGIRGAIAERKQEEMTAYMKEAVALVKVYLPPSQQRIQAAKEAGRVTIQPLPAEKSVRLSFADYYKAGDNLALKVSTANNRLLEAKVATSMDSDHEPVTLDAQFGSLNNGATYPAKMVLNATGKNLQVNIENSGYRKLAQ